MIDERRVPWDPAQYQRFSVARLRPALDLLARVATDQVEDVVDLGCGTGVMFPALRARFPHARLTGVDSSPEMLAGAEGADRLVRADIAQWAEAADVIYSNSALHWVPDHRALFRRLITSVRPGGVLAVQMPANHDRPTHRLIEEVAREGPWAGRLEPVLRARARPVHEPEVYLEILSDQAESVDAWETDYLHLLTGDDPVAQWTRGAALRPYLAALSAEEAEEFFHRYRERIAAVYPRRPDGNTWLRFRRLFVVAHR